MNVAKGKNETTKRVQSVRQRQSHRGALEIESANEPFVMVDAMLISDGGQLLIVQYVNLGTSSEEWTPVIVVKGIEAEYSLAHSNMIRISTPHRFQDVGETLIRDDQEGRARKRKEEYERNEYTNERQEQEHALHHLGMTNVTLGPQTSWNSHDQTDSYSFGGGSWILCTAIQPTSEDEWQKLRKALPPTYNDYTTIHQPRKFAQALGLMFMDQVGPNGRNGKFTHGSTGTSPLVSLHDCQKVIHGPVLYTDDVYGFLDAHQNTALSQIYPLFVKNNRHQDQREYRFVIVGNEDINNQYRDLLVSGMMKDALLPIGKRSSVRFESSSQEQKKDEPISVTSKRYSQRKNQTWSKREKRTRTLTVGEEEKQREEQTQEIIVSLTSESVVSSDAILDLAIGDERHTGNIRERQSEVVEIDGIPIETSIGETVRIGYIKDVEGAEDFFTIEDKREAEEVFECAKMLGQRVLDSPPLRYTVSKLFETTFDPANKKSTDLTSAAWHGLCALVNLHSHFGDVVEKVNIENGCFVSICLNSSPECQANGKLLVGPLGTYAYVLRKGEESTSGSGGEESRLVLFPNEEDAEKFSEYGWLPREVESENE